MFYVNTKGQMAAIDVVSDGVHVMCNTDLLNLHTFAHNQQMLIRRLINEAYNVMA